MKSQNTFGLEWTPELHEPLMQNLGRFSAVEIIPENFFQGRFSDFLNFASATRIPVSIHGVLLSIGSAEPLKQKHLEEVLHIAQQVNSVSYSEHLSMTEAGGLDFDALTPLAWTKGMVDTVSAKIDRIQAQIGYPFLIENVSNRFVVPQVDFSETEFINEVIRKTGCGLLLDITNVFTNSRNFDFDPFHWIDEIDVSAVKAIHLAGGAEDPDGFVIDSHDNQVPPQVWELYGHLCRKTTGFMTIIERTSNLPTFETLIQELEKAREITERYSPDIGESKVRKVDCEAHP